MPHYSASYNIMPDASSVCQLLCRHIRLRPIWSQICGPQATCAVIVEWGWRIGRHSLSCRSSEGRLNPGIKLWMRSFKYHLYLLILHHDCLKPQGLFAEFWREAGSQDGITGIVGSYWYYYGIPHLHIMPTKPLSRTTAEVSDNYTEQLANDNWMIHTKLKQWIKRSSLIFKMTLWLLLW